MPERLHIYICFQALLFPKANALTPTACQAESIFFPLGNLVHLCLLEAILNLCESFWIFVNQSWSSCLTRSHTDSDTPNDSRANLLVGKPCYAWDCNMNANLRPFHAHLSLSQTVPCIQNAHRIQRLHLSLISTYTVGVRRFPEIEIETTRNWIETQSPSTYVVPSNAPNLPVSKQFMDLWTCVQINSSWKVKSNHVSFISLYHFFEVILSV